MHWKVRKKIISANLVYLTEDLNDELCHSIRIQIGNEYTHIELHNDLSGKIIFHPLANGGFNLAENDTTTTSYNRNNCIKILTKSKNYRNNNPKTVDDLIELIKQMNPF